MKIQLENANAGSSSCGNLLSISSLKVYDIQVEEIVSVQIGFRKKDKIIGLKLNRKIIENDIYLIDAHEEITLIKDGLEFKCYINSFVEEIEYTVINIYGSIKELTAFFGPLEEKEFNCEVYYGNGIQYAEILKCPTPSFQFKGLTSTAVIVSINDNASGTLKYRIRYKRTSDLNWRTYEISNLSKHIVNLSPSTEYEVQVMKICGDADFSNYSESSVFSTYSI